MFSGAVLGIITTNWKWKNMSINHCRFTQTHSILSKNNLLFFKENIWSTLTLTLTPQWRPLSYQLSIFLFPCRRLDPTERPLQMLYDYLAAMGYAEPVRVQQEAANSDLSCLIRFYSGEKPTDPRGPSSPISPHNLLLLSSRETYHRD